MGMTEAGFPIIQIINRYLGKAVDLDCDIKANGTKVHGVNPNDFLNHLWVAIPKEEIEKSFKK